jgi:hypothetical protein
VCPILALDPNAVWTDCYNRLLDVGPESIAWLAEQPIMNQPADPNDLQVMLHNSLIRLLTHPAARPRLSANCFETTFDLLHLDIKSEGCRIGTVYLPDGRVPRDWHDLYPAEFDRLCGDLVDAETDRQAICEWYAGWRTRGELPPLAAPLRPRTADAFTLLSRRYADVWTYLPRARPVLCSFDPEESALFRARTCDYNLVRAACVWLGSMPDLQIRDRLIELVGHPALPVAHNAQFALSYSPDPRIRDLLERYKKTDQARLPQPAPSDQDGSWL